MPAVVCPVCHIPREVAAHEVGGKVACRVCGQRMRVPAANRTVLVGWREDEDSPILETAEAGAPPSPGASARTRKPRRRHTGGEGCDRRRRYCPRCERKVLPRQKSRRSALGWVFFAVGIVVFPLFFVGFFLREEYDECPDCGHLLRVGEMVFSVPSR